MDKLAQRETNGRLWNTSKQQRSEIVKRLLVIAEATNEPVSKERIDIYVQHLADLPLPQVCSAIESLSKTSRWFPKIPDIREAVLGKQPTQTEAQDAEAETAWQRVMYFSDSVHPDIWSGDKGNLTTAEFRALQSIGGPVQLQEQMGGGPGFPFLHRDFIQAYKRMKVANSYFTESDQKQLPEGYADKFKM